MCDCRARRNVKEWTLSTMWATQHVFWLSDKSQARRAGMNTQGMELMRFCRLMAPIGSSTISRIVAFSLSEWPFNWVVISFYISETFSYIHAAGGCMNKRRDFAHWAKTQPFKWLLMNKCTSLLFPIFNQFAYVLKRHQAVATLQRPSSI